MLYPQVAILHHFRGLTMQKLSLTQLGQTLLDTHLDNICNYV